MRAAMRGLLSDLPRPITYCHKKAQKAHKNEFSLLCAFVPFCGYNPNHELLFEITGGDGLNDVVEEIPHLVKLISSKRREIDRASHRRHQYYPRNCFHRLNF